VIVGKSEDEQREIEESKNFDHLDKVNSEEFLLSQLFLKSPDNTIRFQELLKEEIFLETLNVKRT